MKKLLVLALGLVVVGVPLVFGLMLPPSPSRSWSTFGPVGTSGLKVESPHLPRVRTRGATRYAVSTGV